MEQSALTVSQIERGDWKCETGKWSTKMLLVDMRSSILSGKK